MGRFGEVGGLRGRGGGGELHSGRRSRRGRGDRPESARTVDAILFWTFRPERAESGDCLTRLLLTGNDVRYM